MLVSVVQVKQLYADKYPLPPELPSLSPDPTPLSSQNTQLSSLCCIAASYLLSTNTLQIIVCIYQCYSLNSSQPLLLPLCPQVHSRYLCHYSYPTNRFISTIFLDQNFQLLELIVSHHLLAGSTNHNSFIRIAGSQVRAELFQLPHSQQTSHPSLCNIWIVCSPFSLPLCAQKVGLDYLL